MRKLSFNRLISALAAFCAVVSTTSIRAEPLGTAFTYQGRFQDGGNPAHGIYDLRFVLCDGATNGLIVSGPLTNSAVNVMDGTFTVSLDFGSGVFSGEARWLEIAVRTNGVGPFATLLPRIAMPATPNALFALRAGSAQIAESVASNAVSSAALAGASITADKLAPGQVVRSLNGFTDAVALSAGSNIVLTPVAGGLQIAAIPSGADGSSWSLAGNAGTTAGAQFLGTTDSRALELKVNSQRALRLEPGGTPNLVGGYSGNSVASGIRGAVISGGGGPDTYGLLRLQRISDHFATISGGNHNRIDAGAPYSAISGGYHNWIQPAGAFAGIGGGQDNIVAGESATLAGGSGNTIQAGAFASSISGGYDNRIGEDAIWNSIVGGWFNIIESGADSSSIGGGSDNLVQPGASSATIPGGRYNQAGGDCSLAAGQRAQALHSGSFVWGDSAGADFTSTGTNQFLIRASGGVGIGTNAPQSALHVVGDIYATGTITPNSDRNLKTGFAPVNSTDLLEKVIAMPIQEWRFLREPDGVRHIGPMAQDFYTAFGLGGISTAIATVDADGVALAAIQGLNQKTEARIQKLEAENAELRARLQKLEQLLEHRLEGGKR